MNTETGSGLACGRGVGIVKLRSVLGRRSIEPEGIVLYCISTLPLVLGK